MTDRLLRAPAVLAITGMSRTTLHRRVIAGEFPPAVKLGPRAVAWRASDIDAWIASLPENETAGCVPAASLPDTSPGAVRQWAQ